MNKQDFVYSRRFLLMHKPSVGSAFSSSLHPVLSTRCLKALKDFGIDSSRPLCMLGKNLGCEPPLHNQLHHHTDNISPISVFGSTSSSNSLPINMCSPILSLVQSLCMHIKDKVSISLCDSLISPRASLGHDVEDDSSLHFFVCWPLRLKVIMLIRPYNLGLQDTPLQRELLLICVHLCFIMFSLCMNLTKT